MERIRPWIIVIEANEPNSTANIRREWEHLVIGHGYALAYFDGLNCFYVADEVAALKERLAVPPNVFDDFVRFQEWAIRQHAAGAGTGSCRPARPRHGLAAAWKAEQAQTANLRTAMHERETQNAILQLQQDQLLVQQDQLLVQQDQLLTQDQLLGRVRQLESQLTMPSVDRAIGRALRTVQNAGDRLTGGGLRSLARRVLTTLVHRSTRDRRLTALGSAILRPFPKVATTLYQLATEKDAAVTSSIPASAEPFPSDDATDAALPASARSTYLRLKAAMSRVEDGHRN